MAHSSEHDGTKALPDVHNTCKDTPRTRTMHDLSMLKHAHYADTEFDQRWFQKCSTAGACLAGNMLSSMKATGP